MSLLYRVYFSSTLSIEEAWNLLETEGVEILYASEEEKQLEFYVNLANPNQIAHLNDIIECTLYQLPAIDWEAQWAMHGQNFHNGYVHIDFQVLGLDIPHLPLKPGAGFGDLSHPTTRLMLKMMAKSLHHDIVVDIGCGSGVLTLAAIKMGALSAYGIDIDPQAVRHAYQNAQLNQLESYCSFCLSQDFIWKNTSKPTLILMNMIQSEQQIAWASLPQLHFQKAEYLTSGIRKEDRSLYLKIISEWKLTLQSEMEEEGWLGFHLKKE